MNILPDLGLGVSGSGRLPGLIIRFSDPIRSRNDNDGLGGGSGRIVVTLKKEIELS